MTHSFQQQEWVVHRPTEESPAFQGWVRDLQESLSPALRDGHIYVPLPHSKTANVWGPRLIYAAEPRALLVAGLFQPAQQERDKAKVVKAYIRVIHNARVMRSWIANPLHSASKHESKSFLLVFFTDRY